MQFKTWRNQKSWIVYRIPILGDGGIFICIYIYTCIDIDIAIVRIPIRGRMTKNIQTILRHGTYRVTPISRCHLPGINQSCRTPCFSPFQPDFFSQTWVFQNPTVFIHKFSTRKSPEIRHSPFQLDPRQLGQPWIGT